MADYTTVEKVKVLVRSVPSASFSTDDEARITQLIPVVTELIDNITGATFGETPIETSRIVEADPLGSNILFLPTRIRSISSIVSGPVWNGTSWASGTTLSGTAWRYGDPSDEGLYITLRRLDGYWHGHYLVTGIWGDQGATDEVPPGIEYVATYVTAELYKKQMANPAGFQGPDGYTLPIRNALNEPEIKKILYAYCAQPLAFVV